MTQAKGVPPVESTPKRVLVVDDDSELLQLVQLLLARLHIETIPASNAAAAAEYLRGDAPLPDLMILDMMLPDISGIEFLRQMRSKSAYNELPVLILSALIDPEQIRAALDSGADRYLTKPYIANNLLTVVQEMLRAGRRRES